MLQYVKKGLQIHNIFKNDGCVLKGRIRAVLSLNTDI